MQPMFRHFLAGSLAVGLMGLGGAAQAMYTWALNSSNNTEEGDGVPSFLGSGAGNKVVVTGWTETSNEGGVLKKVSLTENGSDIYSGGIRIDQNDNPAEEPPQHGLDNDASNSKGRESFVFQFTESIALQQIGFEWARECATAGKTDDSGCLQTADVDVWYYVPAGAPTLAGQTYSQILTNLDTGWKLLGEYDNVTGGGTLQLGNPVPANAGNPPAKTATYWLLTAALDGRGDYDYDFVKVASIGGEQKPGTPPSGGGTVPVPAPLALFVAGLPLLRLARRTR